MNSARNASIYILTAVLLLAGILIFALKGKLLAYMSQEVFGEQLLSGQETPLNPSAASFIDVKILESNSFKKLDDSVLYFDFNYIGKPVPKAGSTTQAPAWKPVYLGNNSPFVIEAPKKK